MTIKKPIVNKRQIEAPPTAEEDEVVDDFWAELRDAKREEFYLRGLLQRANDGTKDKK
jgi:hypothetical protein